MRKMMLCALPVLFGVALYAQDISGDWQGTLNLSPKPLRVILHFTGAGAISAHQNS